MRLVVVWTSPSALACERSERRGKLGDDCLVELVGLRFQPVNQATAVDEHALSRVVHPVVEVAPYHRHGMDPGAATDPLLELFVQVRSTGERVAHDPVARLVRLRVKTPAQIGAL